MLLTSGGLPEAAINLAISGEVQSFASESVLAEYKEVLKRPRLAIDSGKTADAMARILATVSVISAAVRVAAASDPGDNQFLECAEAAQVVPESSSRSGWLSALNEINKDVVRHILGVYFRSESDSGGPSWLTFLGHMEDSLWCCDLFRCESATFGTHWVLVVMDQFTRRIVGSGAVVCPGGRGFTLCYTIGLTVSICFGAS
jgi:hypothetical protein